MSNDSWNFRVAQRRAHEMAKLKGFYDDEFIVMREMIITDDERRALRLRLILARLAMIASEVGEAVNAVRTTDVNVPDYMTWIGGEHAGPGHAREVKTTVHGSELADIVIRTMDLAEFMGIDLQQEIEAKMMQNLRREQKHGKLA